MNRGLWIGAAAYGIWGLFPIYWKLLARVPALQVLAHRIVWSCVVLLAILVWQRRAAVTRVALSRATTAVYLSAALLIGVNWYLYVWAVGAGFVIETSLGYFMTPLVNVLLGVLVLGERLRPLKWGAVALAVLGVALLTRAYGAPPWVALGLAASFGTYGLVKKTAPLPALDGLALETALLGVPAAAFIVLLHGAGTGAFLHEAVTSDLLLVGGGVVTIVPLLLFASAVRIVPLSTMGLLQFISPTIQFILALAVYHEPFSRGQFAGFLAVWLALVAFGLEEVWGRRPPALVPG